MSKITNFLLKNQEINLFKKFILLGVMVVSAVFDTVYSVKWKQNEHDSKGKFLSLKYVTNKVFRKFWHKQKQQIPTQKKPPQKPPKNLKNNQTTQLSIVQLKSMHNWNRSTSSVTNFSLHYLTKKWTCLFKKPILGGGRIVLVVICQNVWYAEKRQK